MKKPTLIIIGSSFDEDENVLSIDTEADNNGIDINEASDFIEEFLGDWPATKEASGEYMYAGTTLLYDKESNTFTVHGVGNIDADEFAGLIEDNA